MLPPDSIISWYSKSKNELMPCLSMHCSNRISQHRLCRVVLYNMHPLMGGETTRQNQAGNQLGRRLMGWTP